MNAEASTVATIKPVSSNSVLVRMGQKFGVEPEKMLATLKATAFKGDVSNEQMMALLVVADQYNLNPWTKEIFAFPDRNAIIPVVSVDGWSRIINSNPQFDGMEFEEGELDSAQIPTWIKCTIHRKDRSHPISTKEYFAEVRRDVGPWKSHPRRMLRHKAMIQCARLAFGFAGIYETDEAERIVEATVPDLGPRPDTSNVNVEMCNKWVGDITDILAQDKEEKAIAADLREADAELSKFDSLYVVVFDELAKRKIISKSKYREYLKVGL